MQPSTPEGEKLQKKKRVWPQSLTKKQLLEEYYDVENQLDCLEYEMFELRRECERRGIDPYK